MRKEEKHACPLHMWTISCSRDVQSSFICASTCQSQPSRDLELSRNPWGCIEGWRKGPKSRLFSRNLLRGVLELFNHLILALPVVACIRMQVCDQFWARKVSSKPSKTCVTGRLKAKRKQLPTH